MPSVKSFLVASLAAAVVASAGGAAVAAGSHLHTLTVNLSDGGVAVIRYAGNAPPQVTVRPRADLTAWPAPEAADWAAPFADLDRIAAEMDRQADAMLRLAMTAAPPAVTAPGETLADFGRLPAGAQGYSFVSSTMGPNACGRSTEIISQGAGKAPRVITRSWGDCGGGPGMNGAGAGVSAGPTATGTAPGAETPRQAGAPRLIETSATLDR